MALLSFLDLIVLTRPYGYTQVCVCMHILSNTLCKLQKSERGNINILLAAGFVYRVYKEIWFWVPEHVESKT